MIIPNTINIIYDSNLSNNHIELQDTYDDITKPRYSWFNNPTTGFFIMNSNVLGITINGIPQMFITKNVTSAANFEGSGYDLTNIQWNNLIDVPQDFIFSNIFYYKSIYRKKAN